MKIKWSSQFSFEAPSGPMYVGGSKKLPVLFLGPCAIESVDHSLFLAEAIRKITAPLGFDFVFKASFDKANRTSLSSYRGPGIEKGLEILSKVRSEVGVPIISDVHLPEQISMASEILDIIQVPAFLSRQTDLLVAVGKSSRPVLLKKAQFMAAEDLFHAANKLHDSGTNRIMLCERGTCFGYHDLVVDFRNISTWRRNNIPAVFDATHSVQVMSGGNGVSLGKKEFIHDLIRAAVAVGIDGLFIETHQDPASAPSDANTMLPLTELEKVLNSVKKISEI